MHKYSNAVGGHFGYKGDNLTFAPVTTFRQMTKLRLRIVNDALWRSIQEQSPTGRMLVMQYHLSFGEKKKIHKRLCASVLHDSTPCHFIHSWILNVHQVYCDTLCRIMFCNFLRIVFKELKHRWNNGQMNIDLNRCFMLMIKGAFGNSISN